MNVSKCLLLIQNSQNDSEMFAALLIVAKAVKSNEVDDAERRKLFEAIGFTFINRLLITKEDTSGVPAQDELFKKIAITLLACFCTDKELVKHTEMINKIPLFVEVFQSFSSTESVSSELFDDVLQCVEAMVDEQECLAALVTQGIIEALGNIYVNKKSGRVFAVLLKLINNITLAEQLQVLFQQPGVKLLNLVCHTFKSSQDAFKFELTKSLYSLLQTIGNNLLLSLSDIQWISDLRSGLSDILRSKISVDQRRSALCLSSLICSCIGLEWTIVRETVTALPDTIFLQLLVHLTEVEVFVILSNSIAEINNSSEFLSACYFIIEVTIIYLSKESSSSDILCENDMLKLHHILSRTLSAIIKFLEEYSSTIEDISSMLTPVVLATLRVFGAWLAEDDLTLLNEVCKVLPLVLDIALADHYQNPPSELKSSQQHPHVLQFLLPGLLHLTAEEKPRRVIIRKGKHKVILEYMMYLIDQLNSSRNGDEEAKLQMCLGIYQNICISERKLLVQDKTFDDVFYFLISCKFKDNKLQPKSILDYALLVSLLITIKHHLCSQLDNDEFASIINRIISILYQNCIPMRKSPENLVTADWEEISEVWTICFQELTAASKVSSMVLGIISDSKQYSELSDVFQTLQEI